VSILSLLADLLLFVGVVLGLGLPWVVAGRFEVAEKLTLGAGVGLLQIYAFAWLVYWTGLPGAAFFALPVLALGTSAMRLGPLREFRGGHEARSLLGRQVLFMTWCLGWLALVRSYGGGEWSADWYEHYERARFFLERQSLDTVFLHVYGLPARPPLANLVDGAFMALSGTDFAHFQVFNTLGSTLFFLPAVQLLRHFTRDPQKGNAVLLLMLMLNPLVMQNATYSWTKLLVTFYVLAAIAFYVRGLREDDGTRRTLAIAAIAAALLTHYSAGPYAVGLAATEVALVWARRRSPAMWRELFLQAILSAGLLATWFAWSVTHYGGHATFFSNTTVTGDAGISPAEWISRRAWNVFVTLVPHPLHPADYRYIAQTSSLGYVRDYCFNIYQTTLPGAFGAAGLLLLAGVLFQRNPPSGNIAERRFWRWFPAAMFLLGVATVSPPDRWGLVHICLPPLVIVGLAWLAAHFAEVPAILHRIWVAALAIDFILGVALHFFLQATVNLAPTSAADLMQGKILRFSQMTTKNMLLKLLSGATFVADRAPAPVLLLIFLSLLLVLAGWQLAAPTADSGGKASC